MEARKGDWDWTEVPKYSREEKVTSMGQDTGHSGEKSLVQLSHAMGKYFSQMKGKAPAVLGGLRNMVISKCSNSVPLHMAQELQAPEQLGFQEVPARGP